MKEEDIKTQNITELLYVTNERSVLLKLMPHLFQLYIRSIRSE